MTVAGSFFIFCYLNWRYNLAIVLASPNGASRQRFNLGGETTGSKILNNALGSLTGDNQRANQALERQVANMAMEFEQTSADKAMKFNADQAQIQREWYERMSNTAHQREVADLRAAGLNPILAANAGAASSATGVASGVSASGVKADVDTYNQMIGMLGALSGFMYSASRLARGR